MQRIERYCVCKHRIKNERKLWLSDRTYRQAGVHSICWNWINQKAGIEWKCLGLWPTMRVEQLSIYICRLISVNVNTRICCCCVFLINILLTQCSYKIPATVFFSLPDSQRYLSFYNVHYLISNAFSLSAKNLIFVI